MKALTIVSTWRGSKAKQQPEKCCCLVFYLRLRLPLSYNTRVIFLPHFVLSTSSQGHCRNKEHQAQGLGLFCCHLGWQRSDECMHPSCLDKRLLQISIRHFSVSCDMSLLALFSKRYAFPSLMFSQKLIYTSRKDPALLIT